MPTTYYLPEELIHEILSRIPIRDVCAFKCVCKSWLKLIESPQFTRSRLSKSVPGLLISHVTDQRTVFKIFDTQSEIFNNMDLRLDRRTRIKGSADGLILFQKGEQYYVCNPITREQVKLPRPEGMIQPSPGDAISYGFGKSGQTWYKVVRIFRRGPQFVCQAYTLGAGKWRRVAVANEGELLEDDLHSNWGTWWNGNLHWLVSDSDHWWVSCFDLEAEAFSRFRAPALESGRCFSTDLGVLRGCLCLCDEDRSESEFAVYTMSCYEDKSWVKECVIRRSPDAFGGLYDQVYPVTVFGDRDGGVLVALHDLASRNLFCYSNNDNAMTDLTWMDLDQHGYFEALLYTPSFVSLRGLFKRSVIEYY